MASRTSAPNPMLGSRSRAAVLAAMWCLLAAGCGAGGGHRTKPLAVTPTSAATTTTAAITYVVKRGDSLTAIAKRFGVTVATIVAGNHLTDQNHLREGQSLAIPPPPPPPQLELVVTPPKGPGGEVFKLALTAAKPSETITFQIKDPAGKTFTGPPHTASAGGEVTTIYRTAPGDPPGTYTVTVTGSQGSNTQGTFAVEEPTTTTT